jgi:hypothetical protein
VFYEDLGATVRRDGLKGVAEQVGRSVLERRPALIVIDSRSPSSRISTASMPAE